MGIGRQQKSCRQLATRLLDLASQRTALEATFCAECSGEKERNGEASSGRGMSMQSSVEEFAKACWSAVSFVAKSCWTDFFFAVSKAHFSNLSVVNDNSLLFSFTLCQN